MSRKYRNGSRGSSSSGGSSSWGKGGSGGVSSYVSSWSRSLYGSSSRSRSRGRGSSRSLLSSGSDTGFLSSGSDTGLLSTGNDTGLLSTGNDTGLLSTGNDTGLLSSGSDTGLLSSGSDTGLLSSGSDTGLLSSGSDTGNSFWGGLVDFVTSAVNVVADFLGFDGEFGYQGGSSFSAGDGGQQNQSVSAFSVVEKKADRVLAQGAQNRDPGAMASVAKDFESELSRAENVGRRNRSSRGRSRSLLPEWGR